MSGEQVTVTLPDATGGIDAELADGTPSWVPSWSLRFLGSSVGITAWNEGVDIDGELHEGAAVDELEDEALRVLAAVHAHRRFAAEAAA